MISGIALTGWMCVVAPPSADEPAPARSQIELLVLRVVGADPIAIGSELALRSPGLVVRELSHVKQSPDAAYGFAEVRASSAGLGLVLILEDGRAYRRDLGTGIDQPERAIATALANLLDAIAEDRIEADEADVDMPTLGESTPGVASLPGSPDPPAPVEIRSEHPAVLSIGVSAGSHAIVGVGPPAEVPGRMSPAGTLGFQIQLRGAAMLEFEARVAGTESLGFRTTRVRTLVGAGYGWGRGDFEFRLGGRLGVEPWRIDAEGRRQSVVLVSTERRAVGIMWVAAARISPGFVLQRPGRRMALCIAFPIEFAFSSGWDQAGTAQVDLRSAGGDSVPLVRFGGPELLLGVEIGVRGLRGVQG